MNMATRVDVYRSDEPRREPASTFVTAYIQMA